MIIGLAGLPRVGKDTFAQVVVEKHGYTQVAFADKLKEFLFEQDAIVGYDPAYGLVSVRDVVMIHGWEGAKKTKYYPELRRLLRMTGTEGGRGVLGDNIWIDKAFEVAKPYMPNVVFSDVRFPNEAEAVVNAGGRIVLIERPEVDTQSMHSSDSIDKIRHYASMTIVNQDGIDRFKRAVEVISLSFLVD